MISNLEAQGSLIMYEFISQRRYELNIISYSYGMAIWVLAKTSKNQ